MTISSNSKHENIGVHQCSLLNNGCIKTSILKQHIKGFHGNNENTPCELCKSIFILSCLLEKNQTENESARKKSNICEPFDIAFESEINDSMESEYKIVPKEEKDPSILENVEIEEKIVLQIDDIENDSVGVCSL